MSDWQDWIGRSEQRTDLVTSGLVARLRATINSADIGEVAPQGIHWCLCLPDTATAQLGEDGHPRRAGLPVGKAQESGRAGLPVGKAQESGRAGLPVGKAQESGRDIAGAFLPPIPLPRRMWASSKLAFHAPIAVGAAVARTSTITAITEKAGSSGPLVFVTLVHETRCDGALAVEEEQVLVYRGAGVAPVHSAVSQPCDWPHVRNLVPSEAMMFRYSALTFNAHRIHYDAPYAQRVEGYRGLVVHGPLSATLLIDLAREISSGAPLKSFEFRGVSPLFCGEPMTLVARRDESAITLAALGPTDAVAMEARAVF
ncbi:MAG: MaoC family dehydratase N-terminal domain-containing protein [Sphingopyxis sp.]